MNDPNYQGNYDKYVISEAAQAAAKAAAEAAILVGKNNSDAQIDAIKATTSIAIESVIKISNAVAETNSAVKAMADAANNKTYNFNNDAQSLVDLENIAVQAGYSGDYTDTYVMQSYLNSVGYKAYANGGIANTPSIFGEAGPEAAVPLPDGRSIPVKIINPSNDSNINTAETIAELKSQNQKLEVLVNTMMATSKAEREKTQELIDAMNGLRTDTRLKNKA